jgi:hypothetical protein
MSTTTPLDSKMESIRKRAESDLLFFIKLVHPQRVIGHIHEELCNWWQSEETSSHSLVLLPRDHGKSAYAAYHAAWEITRNPAIRILYISSTANLAIKQLGFIGDILESDVYQRYWPDMIHPDKGKRKKWTEKEISVDHPLRAKEAVRDPTVFTAGLDTGITGLHCDIAYMDDVVVRENAYSAEGRAKVQSQFSLLTSITGTDARVVVVGTRYHPRDLYNDIAEMEFESYNEHGEVVSKTPLYTIMERAVEDLGDGTGQFLWPRQQRYDGKWFGFDRDILAKKRAQYLDRLQYYAQYYNNPNDPESQAVNSKYFQYYEPEYIRRRAGQWYMRDEPLNVFAAIDFAFSLSKEADYTCIVVIGVDAKHNYYVLDIDRFKTGEIVEYFEHILRLHQKWDFRKLRAEVNVAQQVIVNTLKTEHIRKHGLALSIDEHRPTAASGRKEERLAATLYPRYQNYQMWHYRGGNCQILEDELVAERPPHDDVKDTLMCAVDVAVAPMHNVSAYNSRLEEIRQNQKRNRFGGTV